METHKNKSVAFLTIVSGNGKAAMKRKGTREDKARNRGLKTLLKKTLCVHGNMELSGSRQSKTPPGSQGGWITKKPPTWGQKAFDH